MANNNVNISLLLKTKGFSQGLKRATGSLQKFEQVGQTVGRTMQYALGGGIIVAAGAAAKAAIDFDRMQSKLTALIGDGQGVEQLATSARALGESSLYTAAQIAEAQLQMKRLGLSVTDIDKVDNSVVKLATALDLDLVQATDLAIKTINKFGDTFGGLDIDSATEQIGEGLVVALTDSALTAEGLTQSLKYVGAEGNALGFSFNEIVAILGELANKGYEGSKAGTVLRKVLTELGREGGNTKNKFYELISSGGEFVDFLDRVGLRAAGGAKSLDGFADEVKSMVETMDKSEGQLDRFSEILGEDLTGGFKQLISASQEASQKLLDEFKPALQGVVDDSAKFVRQFGEQEASIVSTTVALLAISKAFNIVKGLLAGVALKAVNVVKNFNPVSGIFTAIAIAVGEVNIAMKSFNRNMRDGQRAVAGLDSNGSFLTKLQSGTFASQADFLKEAKGYAASLQTELDRVNLREAFNLSQREVDTLTEMAGRGVTAVTSSKNEFGDGGVRTANLQGALDAILATETAKDELKLINDAVVKAQAGTAVYWKTQKDGAETTTKAAKDLIKEFEAINGTPIADGSVSDEFESIGALITILKDEQNALNESITEQTARQQDVNKELVTASEENDKLLEYYEAQQRSIQAQYDLQVKMNAARQQGVSYMGVQQQHFDAHNKALQDQHMHALQVMDAYNQLMPMQQTMAENMALNGTAFSEAVNAQFELLDSALGATEQQIGLLGDALTRAMVDPAVSAKQALGDWAKQLAVSLAKATIEFLAIAGLIKLLDALTNGAFGASLKLMADAGGGGKFGQVQGTMSMFGGNRNMAAEPFQSVRGFVSGSDLVLATSRGVHANDRLYG